MLINNGSSRLVIGRISILPGEKVPTFPLTGAEAAEVKRLTEKGVLVEKGPVKQPVQKPVEQPKVEKPAEKPAEDDKAKKPQQPKSE